MAYAVYLTSPAQDDLEGLPKDIQERLASALDALAENPRSGQVTKLEGEDDLYRIRLGPYRIVYTISDSPPEVTITMIRHRKDSYRLF